MSHQKQYQHIGERIPTEYNISLLATGRSLHYDLFNFNSWSTVSNEMRSNFITSLSFLSLYYEREKNYHVVIMGGLTVRMVEYLNELFPDMSWDLWGSNKKMKRNNITANIGFIKISYNKDDVYQTPSGKEKNSVLFLSFNRDMNYNQRLHYFIGPKYAIVPFTVDKANMKYFDGHLLNIVWNEQNSKWTNLLIKRGQFKEYDQNIYNLNCFNFNLDYRVRSYPSIVINNKFDHCYDCAMETSIWELYMLKMNQPPIKDIIENYMMTLDYLFKTDS